jgi:hypothetical protein
MSIGNSGPGHEVGELFKLTFQGLKVAKLTVKAVDNGRSLDRIDRLPFTDSKTQLAVGAAPDM